MQVNKHVVIDYFKQISEIPRESGNEKAVSIFVKNALIKLGASAEIDEYGNVYAYRKGNGQKPLVLLQAHLDMVCAKKPTSKHNFSKDGIQVYDDNGWLKAKDTSLGADNGIGVATILALFANKNLHHIPFEALFTVEEETTCIGANKVKANKFKSKYLINLDWEYPSHVVIGCCECLINDVIFDIKKQKQNKNTINLEIKIGGANSGHSGLDIHKVHANPIVEIFNMLNNVQNKNDLYIVNVNTPDPENAIGHQASVVVNIKKEQLKLFKSSISESFHSIKHAFLGVENSLELKIESSKIREDVLTQQYSDKLINFICAANDGLNRYDFKLSVSDASTNLSLIKLSKNDVKISWIHRAQKPYFMNVLLNKITSLASLINAKVINRDHLLGLEPDFNNKLAHLIQKIAQEKLKHEMSIIAINGGLEVSEITAKYPNLTAVSIGPNILDQHTYKERVEIKSIIFLYNLLAQILISIDGNKKE